MLKDILVRATALLAEIKATPVPGTTFRAAEDVPQDIQDFEVYVAFLTDVSHTSNNTGNKERLNRITWSGLLLGPQILTGNSYTNRVNLLQYADLIAQKFYERPQLNDAEMRVLNGVRECVFTGGRVFSGPYPQGQSAKIRLQYSFVLDIEYLRLRKQSH